MLDLDKFTDELINEVDSTSDQPYHIRHIRIKNMLDNYIDMEIEMERSIIEADVKEMYNL